MELDEYIKLLRIAKTGKYTVIYNNLDEKKKRISKRKSKTVNHDSKVMNTVKSTKLGGMSDAKPNTNNSI
jgi:hypothetical protein